MIRVREIEARMEFLRSTRARARTRHRLAVSERDGSVSLMNCGLHRGQGSESWTPFRGTLVKPVLGT